MLDFRPKMFDEASKSHASKNIVIIIICFIVVMAVIFLLELIIPAVLIMKPMMQELYEQGYLSDPSKKFTLSESMKITSKLTAPAKVMIPMLFSTVFGTLVSIFYCRCVEMRPVRSMGARKKGFFAQYISGLAAGFVMMSAIALLSAALGITRLKLCSNINFGIIGLYFLGFVVQGMSEEFIFRGYLMNTIGGSGYKTYIAVAVSAAIFALAHASNPGFGPLPFINLTMFGVFAALTMILYDNIWGVCAIHSIWNFTQGCLYGISVSGSSGSESILRSTPVSSHAFLTGGKFGIEGSIITTLVLGIGIASSLYALSRKEPQKEADTSENVSEDL